MWLDPKNISTLNSTIDIIFCLSGKSENWGDVKKMAKEYCNIEPEHMRLIYNGRQLKDWDTLECYDAKAHSEDSADFTCFRFKRLFFQRKFWGSERKFPWCFVFSWQMPSQPLLQGNSPVQILFTAGHTAMLGGVGFLDGHSVPVYQTVNACALKSVRRCFATWIFAACAWCQLVLRREVWEALVAAPAVATAPSSRKIPSPPLCVASLDQRHYGLAE